MKSIKYTEVENLYSDVKEWLKFSESKNAALLTLNVAFLFWIIRLSMLNVTIPKNYYMTVMLFFLFVSVLVNLLSFFPMKAKDKEIIRGDFKYINLLYYANISKLGIRSTRDFLANKYYDDTIDDPYFIDLTNQIYSISVITNKKNIYFKISLMITIASLVLLSIQIIFY